MPNEGYTLDIDHIFVGRRSTDLDATSREAFIGYMQNFYFDHHRFFDSLSSTDYESRTDDWFSIYEMTFKKNTNSYVILPTIQVRRVFCRPIRRCVYFRRPIRYYACFC